MSSVFLKTEYIPVPQIPHIFLLFDRHFSFALIVSEAIGGHVINGVGNESGHEAADNNRKDIDRVETALGTHC